MKFETMMQEKKVLHMRDFLVKKFQWNVNTVASMDIEVLRAYYKLHLLHFNNYIEEGHDEETSVKKVIESLCKNVLVEEGNGYGSQVLSWTHFYQFRKEIATKEKMVKAVYCGLGTFNHSHCETVREITEGETFARSTISLTGTNIQRGTLNRYQNENSMMENGRLVKINPKSVVLDYLKTPGLSAYGVSERSLIPEKAILFKTTTDGFALYDKQSGGLMNTLSCPEPEALKLMIKNYAMENDIYHGPYNGPLPYNGAQSASINKIIAVGHCPDDNKNNKLVSEDTLNLFKRYY